MIEEMQWVRPEEIEARSMAIIESEMPKGSWSAGELAVVKRCIHTAADFDYAENLYFSPHAVEQAVAMMKSGNGFTIVTDTNMALAGVNKAALKQLNGNVRCFMADPDVAAEAKERGVTRAIVSMERAAKLSGPVIFAIGNAPTALIRLYEMMQNGEICQSDVPCIVARGRKGGSNIAAAVCNALMYQVTRA